MWYECEKEDVIMNFTNGNKYFLKFDCNNWPYFTDDERQRHYVNDWFLKEFFTPLYETEVQVTPRSFEIKSGTCTADLWHDDFDFGEYDVHHIDDIIAVATKAKELYEEYFAKE